MKPVRWFSVLMLGLATGCATAQSVTWNREDIRPKAITGDRQLERVKLWSGDSVFVWHWVTITPDSIRGYPEQRTGQVVFRALPLSVVDSLRVGYTADERGDDREDSGHDPFGSDLAIIGLILLALFTP